jgi:hypothetical protein
VLIDHAHKKRVLCDLIEVLVRADERSANTDERGCEESYSWYIYHTNERPLVILSLGSLATTYRKI